MLINNAGAAGKAGDGQTSGSVLETLLSLILSEKAGINLQENAATSKPLEEFIRQFANRPAGDGQDAKKATAETSSAGRKPGPA